MIVCDLPYVGCNWKENEMRQNKNLPTITWHLFCVYICSISCPYVPCFFSSPPLTCIYNPLFSVNNFCDGPVYGKDFINTYFWHQYFRKKIGNPFKSASDLTVDAAPLAECQSRGFQAWRKTIRTDCGRLGPGVREISLLKYKKHICPVWDIIFSQLHHQSSWQTMYWDTPLIPCY